MQVIVLAIVKKSGEDEVKASSSSTVSVTRVEDKGSKKDPWKKPRADLSAADIFGPVVFYTGIAGKERVKKEA